MLPLLVGGPELSFSIPDGVLSRDGAPHDQLFKWSTVLPFENGGVFGLEISVRPDEALVSEYDEKLSRIR